MKYVILIADDEAEIRDLLSLYLENSGYDVPRGHRQSRGIGGSGERTCGSCSARRHDTSHERTACAEKDWETSNIPVLVFSAKDTDADKILGLNLGADDYLTKPFNPLEAVAGFSRISGDSIGLRT